MSGIQLTLSLQKMTFLSGESMELEVCVINNGTEDVSLQTSPDVAVEYELRSIDEGIVQYRISSNDLPWRNESEAPEEDPEFDSVLSGQSVSYVEDIASYVSGGIGAGSYHLVALCKTSNGVYESQPEKIVVQQPQVGRYHMDFCTYSGSFVSILTHQDSDQKSFVYQRETTTSLGDYGVFYRYAEFEKLKDLTSSTHTAPRLRGRWFAVVQEDNFSAFLTDEGDLIAGLSETPLELTQPGLIQPGFQLDPAGKERFGPALFLVKGMQDQQAYVQPFSVSPDAIKPGKKIHLGSSLPEQIMAGYSKARPGNEIVLAWMEKTAGGFRILRWTLTRNGDPTTPDPVVVLEKDFPLLDLQLAPISVSEDHWVHALIGPVKIEEVEENKQVVRRIVHLSYLRIPLVGSEAKIEEYEFQAPEGSNETPATGWAISGFSTGGCRVVAEFGNDILHASARKFSSWEVLSSGLIQTRHLHLAAAMRDYWCATWVGATGDIIYGPDPDYEFE